MKTKTHTALLAGMLIAAQTVLLAGPAFSADKQPAKHAAKHATKHATKHAAQQQGQPASKNAVTDVKDLPITELPQGKESTDMLGILISGDGGWWGLDDTVSKVLAEHGIPVIGMSSHDYFAKPRTPDETAADMYRALRFYMKKWDKQRIVLLGYSLGAEIIPFVATRVPEDLKDKVVMVIMIGPSADTMFEFHLSDWVISPTNRAHYPVQPEIEKINGPKVLCVTSTKDEDCICDKLDSDKVMMLKREGNHHFNDDFKGVADAIWEKVKEVTVRANVPGNAPVTTPATAPAEVAAAPATNAPASDTNKLAAQ